MKKLYHRVWAEIDLDALGKNLETIRRLAPGRRIVAVVKANAYGHGVSIVAPELFRLGVSDFAVSNLEEALELRALLPTAEILIFGYCDEEWFGELLGGDLVQTVGSVPFARALSGYAAARGTRARVQIKVDTGMARVGVDTAAELGEILALPGLRVEGVYTHFSSADSLALEDKAYTDEQERRLLEISAEARRAGIAVYSQNSGGILYHGDYTGDRVRSGIITYGCKPGFAEEIPPGLTPIMTLKSRVCQVKRLPPGTAVSYGRTFVTDRPTEAAVIPAGYADGYSRALSNKGAVYIGGARCPILGRVCMDQTIVDVTGKNVSVGDTAILYSASIPEITADAVADSIGTIGYELLCAVGARVPRVAVRGDKILF
ncbi:MAG: alanine racemase [Bacteroides sp.]|nr:alanine racemase [Eubacterium sp.]MCM1418031.1 alanine racemase [Roseburia sp.]MCM1462146.1 alanine racemase [Bacteroides sp.]